MKLPGQRTQSSLLSLNAYLWRLLCCILLLQASTPSAAWAQTGQTLGFLQLTGEVDVNGMRAANGQTIFSGDTVRTGADGAAVFNLPDVGTLTIEKQSEVSFHTGQSIATLKQGTIDVRSIQAGTNLDVQFGRFLLFTSAVGSAGILTVDANGAARIECRSGSIAVTAVGGPQAVFLQPGQSVSVTAVQNVESAAPGAPTPTGAPAGTAPAAKKSRTAYYILGAAGAAGATTAVILLVARKSSPPVSPASP
jgi:hypothetical protein